MCMIIILYYTIIYAIMQLDNLTTELNEKDFPVWVECGRLFQMGWLRTALSTGLNVDGFPVWVECGRLFQMG